MPKNRNPFCQPDLSKIDQRRRAGCDRLLAEPREPPSRRSGGPRSRPAPNWGRFVGHSIWEARIVSKSEQRAAVGRDRLVAERREPPSRRFPKMAPASSPRTGAASRRRQGPRESRPCRGADWSRGLVAGWSNGSQRATLAALQLPTMSALQRIADSSRTSRHVP